MVTTTYEGRTAHRETATAEAHARHDGRSLADLIRELRDETTQLVRNEVKLARVEMSEKASRVSRNGAYMAIGGVIAGAALVVLMFAAAAGAYVGLVAAGLTHMTAGWLAPLIIGVAGAIIGYVMIQKGVSTIKRESLVPERTAESLREDKEWIERKVR